MATFCFEKNIQDNRYEKYCTGYPLFIFILLTLYRLLIFSKYKYKGYFPL